MDDGSDKKVDINQNISESMDLKSFVGNTATIFTVITFLTGVQICLRIWRLGTTTDISSFPFIAGFVSASLWLQYGLFVHDSVVITVNTIGGFLQLSYILWYYAFTPVRSNLNRRLIFLCIFMVAFYGYLHNIVQHYETATLISGLTACCAGIVFCGSPLASLAEVRRNKSVESLPFLLIFFSFIVTFLWFLYGLLVHDTFIQVPNFLGCVIAGFQLLLFAIYPSKKHDTTIM